jgi:PAS domain S-box-containing protein
MMSDKSAKLENDGTVTMSPEDENRILKARIKELEESFNVYEKRALEQKKALQVEIGRHKETEAALRVSQRQLSQAMELAGIVYWEIDVEPEILFCNDAFYDFYGTTAEQEGGYAIPVEQYAKKFVHPDDLQKFFKNKEVMDATRKREFSADIEHRIIRADGDVRTIQALVRVQKDPDGHTTRIYGAHQDISDRKQIEDDLRENAHFLQTLLDAIPSPVFYKDIHGVFQGCNAAYESDTGLKRKDIIGKTAFDLFPRKMAERYHALDMALFRQGGTQIYEAEARSADNKPHEVVFHKAIYTNEAGETSGLVGVVLDVTERKRAEEALRLSEAYYRALIENISDMVSILNIDGTIRYDSPSVKKILGYDPSELIGKNTFDLIHPEDLAAVLATFKTDASRPGAVSRHEVRRRHKNGSWRVVEVLRQNLMDNEAIKGVLVTARDITERKQMEKALCSLNDGLERKVEERTRQLAKAQDDLVRKEKLAILGQLAGTVGHELRNPLGVMSNAVYYLKTVLSDHGDKMLEYLNIIQNEIANSLKIITELLEFSRTTPPRKIPVPLDMWVNQSVGRCTLPENIAVKTDIPDGLPLVNMDHFQMTQVLQNLITNAVQAMPEGGRLEIAAGLDVQEEVPAEATENHAWKIVKIHVKDTGTGISPEHMAHLFQPLFTTKAKGIGLGLVVCKNLVEANGGEISVESLVGKGTTFTIVIPTAGGGNENN